MFALSSFLGEVYGKGGVPEADVFGGVIEGVTKITGASLLHVGIAVFELPGLVSRWGHPSVSQQLVGGIKPGEVANLGQDHGPHAVSNPRNSSNWRMQFLHDGLDCSLDFLNLGVQLSDKPNGVLQFQGLGGHPGANRASGSVPDIHCRIPSVAALGGIGQQGFQPGQVYVSDLLGPWELRQQRINRRHVKCRNQLFQFGEEDAHQPGNRLLQLGPFFYLVKTISGE